MQDLTVDKSETFSFNPVAAVLQRYYFVLVCLGLVLMNFLTFAYHLTGSSAFNGVSNAVSLLLIAYSMFLIVTGHDQNGFYRIVLLLAFLFVGLSFLANLGAFDFIDGIKLMSTFLFYVAGRSGPKQLRTTEKLSIYTLVVLPLIFTLSGETKIYVGSQFPDVFSYFPNTNTAALYFSACFFALSQWHGNKVLIFQFINAAAMNRVGAALSTILAIGIWSVFPLRMRVFVAIFLLGLASYVAYSLGLLDRLVNGLESIALIWSLDPSTVARMSYKDLIELTGTNDTSAFFRIIHWTNIWQYYTSQGLGVILFGYGAGQTGVVAYMPLPPHNDYLRVLAEYGVFTFLLFVTFLTSIVFALKQQAAKTIFTVLLIYFLSENLLDNFTSMVLFFVYAGRLTSGNSEARTGISSAGLTSSAKAY